jgi:hypothetical protein
MSGRSSDISGFKKLVSWTPSGTVFSTCRGVIATTAGTIDCVDADGNSLSAVPVVVGVNPYQLTKISAASASLGLFLGY